MTPRPSKVMLNSSNLPSATNLPILCCWQTMFWTNLRYNKMSQSSWGPRTWASWSWFCIATAKAFTGPLEMIDKFLICWNWSRIGVIWHWVWWIVGRRTITRVRMTLTPNSTLTTHSWSRHWDWIHVHSPILEGQQECWPKLPKEKLEDKDPQQPHCLSSGKSPLGPQPWTSLEDRDSCGSYPGGSDTQDTCDRKDNVVRIREKRKRWLATVSVASIYTFLRLVEWSSRLLIVFIWGLLRTCDQHDYILEEPSSSLNLYRLSSCPDCWMIQGDSLQWHIFPLSSLNLDDKTWIISSWMAILSSLSISLASKVATFSGESWSIISRPWNNGNRRGSYVSLFKRTRSRYSNGRLTSCKGRSISVTNVWGSPKVRS